MFSPIIPAGSTALLEETVTVSTPNEIVTTEGTTDAEVVVATVANAVVADPQLLIATAAAVANAAVLQTTVLSTVAAAVVAVEAQQHLVDNGITTATTPAVAVTPSNDIIAVFSKYRVPLYENKEMIPVTLQSLQTLQSVVQTLPYPLQGNAPGFFTITPSQDYDVQVNRTWTYAPNTPYETLDCLKNSPATVPLPFPEFVSRCCDIIHEAIQMRAIALCSSTKLCLCLSEWSYFKRAVPIESIANQALEQLMTKEASTVIEETVNPLQWNETYQAALCPAPSVSLANRYIPNTPIRLLRNRDIYLKTLVEFALACESTIQINTCYLFATDTSTRYIMLDLLPYCIREHGIKVEVLLDLMTVESAIIKSALHLQKPESTTTNNEPVKEKVDETGTISETSFLKFLPKTAPAFTTKGKKFKPLEFFQKIIDVAQECGKDNYEIRWWCARDAERKYRIKNHSKNFIFDKHAAIVGGSNICPMLSAATTELDLVVAGPLVEQICESAESLWHAAGGTEPITTENVEPVETAPVRLSKLIDEQCWDDDNCKVAFVKSRPSSLGEDAILRTVIGAINESQKRVVMCFGHSNYPRPLVDAFAQATARGVRVEIIVNSKYSCDLRTGQRDLFISIQQLLHYAPDVEVYTTAMHDDGTQPSFIHAKYLSIDGKWSAIGSWNVWTRSCFYEIEHEAIIESEQIANELINKFEHDKKTSTIRLFKPEDCIDFLPTGCLICEGFGPFYK